MLPGNICPNLIAEMGIKSLLSNHNMLSFFKKFCDSITSRMWKFKRAKNAKYEDVNFLKVFFFSEVIGRSIHNTSEQLNEYILNHRKGRRKIYQDGRKKRQIPHQTEVNKYLRKIGLAKARNILRECLDEQLKDALKLNLISKKVNVLIDFTEHPYYGKREDRMIKGTNRQKGTKKMRHYLGFSIFSRNIHLYAGLEQVAKGQSKVPIILKTLDHLLELGFELNYVLMDREFYRVELLDEIKGMGGNIIIPAKSYKKVRQYITEYLNGTKNRIIKYTFLTAPDTKFQFCQHVYLIIKAKRGYSLQGVKKDYKGGNITLKDAQRRIFTIMTTEKPKGKTSSWASRICLFYRRRWNIETGFSDLNRINSRWKSNYDSVRYLDMLVRYILYNSWKTNKELIKKGNKNRRRLKNWTLVRNQDYLRDAFLLSQKKSQEVIG